MKTITSSLLPVTKLAVAQRVCSELKMNPITAVIAGYAHFSYWFFTCVLLMGILIQVAYADNQNGFSLAIGPSAHYAHAHIIDSVYQDYQSVGLGFYGDAQFVINSRWSMNPYLEIATEHAHGDLHSTVLNSEGGVQLRRWWNNFYWGAEINFSAEQLIQQQGIARANFGPGIGTAIGWEPPSGLTYGLQLEAPEAGNGTTSHRVASWFWLGYRWH